MWFWYALGSAVLGGIDITLNKQSLHKVSAAVLTWCVFTFSIPLVAFVALKSGIPSISQIFYVGIMGSSIFFVFGKTLMNVVLKDNLVSKIFPLSAFSGFFTYVFGLIILGENIRLIPLVGLASIIFGSYILNADQAREDLLRPFKLLFTSKPSMIFLLGMALSSLTTIFDKMGINNTSPTSPAFVLLCENIIMSGILGVFILTKERRTWPKDLTGNFKLLLLNAIVYAAVSLLIMYAFAGGPVALATGIKRLQIFFVLILAFLFFKDKPTKHTWIATAVMIVGALMIKLG